MSKIVVVEDQQVLATVYRNKFVAEGYQVEVASDGEAGLALINTTQPDLVILDLILPKMNGIDVLKNVRANPVFQTLPVIIFSNASLVEEAWKAGATMVLSKSSHSPKQIVESVRAALQAASDSQQRDAPVDRNAAPSIMDTTVLSRSCGTPGNILLIEDHPDVRALLSFLLDQAGHQVTSVESHAAALRRLDLQEFDLLVINRVCPDGPGVTLCSQLRHSFPQQPIIMYSTAALPAEQQAGLGAGAQVYLANPGELLTIGSLSSRLIKESKTSIGLRVPAPLSESPLAA